MKRIHILLVAGTVLLLAGCSSTPVALGPVGPDPFGGQYMAADGRLQVFSRMAGRTEGNNPTWYQHAGYSIYDLQGKLVKHVENSTGKYEEAPQLVALPAGKYFVKARAQGYLNVKVPVTISRGQITKVHLDDRWARPANVSKDALVSLPDGNPVGWRATAGIN